MIHPIYPLRSKGLPLHFYLENARVSSVEVDEDGGNVILRFSSGFFFSDRDGKKAKDLYNAVMTVRLEDGAKVVENTKIIRRVWITRQIKLKTLRKNVEKKGLAIDDILYSHHTRSIIVEGQGKGHVAIQIDKVRDIKLDFLEPHTKIYDSYIVNRRDVFRLGKKEKEA